MTKKVVYEDEYIDLCNQELKRRPDYEDGMEIVGVPEGYSGSRLTGFEWKGPDSKRDIFARVTSAVNEKYVRGVTPRTASKGD